MVFVDFFMTLLPSLNHVLHNSQSSNRSLIAFEWFIFWQNQWLILPICLLSSDLPLHLEGFESNQTFHLKWHCRVSSIHRNPIH